jgi:Txe/YoeB family toxin of toxin-antitoxin system
VTWDLHFERRAQRDSKLLEAAGLKGKADGILDLLQSDPYYRPPPFEKLIADLRGCYSRRINKQHRLVYEIRPDVRQVVVQMMYGHYRD